MTIRKPFHRTSRQFSATDYGGNGHWQYVLHSDYAKAPAHFVRAFLLILKDMHELFDYVEPAKRNRKCYSYRIHQLLLRACIEVEANCKAIMTENTYQKDSNKLTMQDYKKIERSHRLSAFKIIIPAWHGSGNVRQPFKNWANNGSLPWYAAYNTTKHNRQQEFKQATFQHMNDAIAGLCVILSAQFITHDFSPADTTISLGGFGQPTGTESAIGGFFRIIFPNDWPMDERYNFNWEDLAVRSPEFIQLRARRGQFVSARLRMYCRAVLAWTRKGSLAATATLKNWAGLQMF